MFDSLRFAAPLFRMISAREPSSIMFSLLKPRACLHPVWVALLWLVVGGATHGSATVHAQAQGSLVTAAQIEATEALSRRQVRTFIGLRLSVDRLQRQYRANAADYDDVIQAFFEAREQLLRRNGWTPDGFDALAGRIRAAESAMDMQTEPPSTVSPDTLIDTVDAALREILNEIESTPGLSDEQRAQMRQQVLDQQEQIRDPALADSMAAQQDRYTEAEQRMIDATRPDWPAVRSYLDTLTHLTEYIAGNRPDPPNVDRLTDETP